MERMTRYETRDEWLAARGLGASDVAAILAPVVPGLHAYRSPWDVWARSTTVVFACSKEDP